MNIGVYSRSIVILEWQQSSNVPLIDLVNRMRQYKDSKQAGAGDTLRALEEINTLIYILVELSY